MEYEMEADGVTFKLDADGNKIPKQAPPADDGVPQWLVAVNTTNNRNTQLEAENARLQAQINSSRPPEQIPSLAEGDVYAHPDKLVSAISAVLERQIKPLQNFQQEYQRDQEYSKLKNRIKAVNPGFVHFCQNFEGLLDQEMSNKAVNEAELARAVQMVLGGVAVTNPQFFAPKAPTTAPITNPPAVINNNNTQIPPHLRSNAAPNLQLVRDQAKVDPSNWDENTRRLWRDSGLSAEDYVTVSNCDPNELAEKYKEIKNRGKK